MRHTSCSHRGNSRIRSVAAALAVVTMLTCSCSIEHAGDSLAESAAAPVFAAGGLPPIPAGREALLLSEYLISGNDTFGRGGPAIDDGSALALGGSALAWGMYAFNFNDDSLDSLRVSLDAQVTNGLWIGLADYEAGRWDFSGPFTADSTLVITAERHLSPAGNVYIVVVLDTGEPATVSALAVRTINPANEAPVAALQADLLAGTAPLSVGFDAAASSDSDGTIIEYAWDFDGDGLYEGFSDTPQVEHVFTNPGMFNTRMRVTDDQLARSSVQLTISVGSLSNSSPLGGLVADPLSGEVPLNVEFDGSSSLDPDGNIVRFDWDFDGDGAWDQYDGLAQMSHTYQQPGVYQARMRITDDKGAQDVVAIVITAVVSGNLPPVAAFTPDDVFEDAPATIDFDASSSNAGGDDGDSVVHYEWDWEGDGTYDSSGESPLATHTFASYGVWRPALRVTDEAGNQGVHEGLVRLHGATQQVGEMEDFGGYSTLGIYGGNPLVMFNDFIIDEEFGTETYWFLARQANDPFGIFFEQATLAIYSPPPIIVREPTLVTFAFTPSVAYRNDFDGTLMWSRAPENLDDEWVSNQVDPAVVSGAYPSVAQVNGRPAISFADLISGELRFVRALDKDGINWPASSTVSDVGEIFGTSSLQVVEGQPAISFYRSDDNTLRYVRATDANGSAWGSPVQIPSPDDIGAFHTLAVINGRPAICLVNNTDASVEYCRALDSTGLAWPSPLTLDDSGDIGFTNHLLQFKGVPCVLYYRDANLIFCRARDGAGNNWHEPDLLAEDSLAENRPQTVEAAGELAVSFVNETDNTVHYLRGF